MPKITIYAWDKNWNCLGEYTYLSKVDENSTPRQHRAGQSYIRKRMNQMLNDFDNAYEITVDYGDK
jgi:hypothetical protein